MIRLRVFDGEHREIVALLGVADELVDSVGHRANQRLWRGVLFGLGGEDGRHTILSELVVSSVFGLGQSVGIEEDGRAGRHHRFLFHELPVREGAYGQVRLDGEAVALDVRRIMAAVAVRQSAGSQVEGADEEGDEHVVVVALADVGVHGLDDLSGAVGVGGDVAEERSADGHDEGSGNALAGNVADTEKEFFTPLVPPLKGG